MAEARITILCIDDDRQTARLIAEELAERGFEVVIARDGHEGFIAILKGLPDLVLCDIGLPDMSGFDLLERLNKLSPGLGRVPFVFVTALTGRKNKQRAQRLGADDYITKPFGFEMLEVTIKARLARASSSETWPKPAMLSDNEAAAVTCVADGKTSTQIAEVLGLGERQVDLLLGNARAKLRRNGEKKG
jgi:DNA-binding response OmpR family regulator